MRSRFLLFALVALAFSPPLLGQSSPGAKTFTLKAANQNACVGTAGLPTVNITLSGTANLTLTPQVSVNGGTASNSSVTSTVGGSQPQATIVVTTTITAATSGYSSPVGGSDSFCLNVSSYSSGSLTVVLNPSPALNASLLGGPGAVTSVFTRTGAVVAVSGDYTCSQVTGCTTGGIPINGTPAAYPSSVTSFDLFGDSITEALGVQYQNQSYGYTVAAALGATVGSDLAVTGDQANDFLSQAYTVTPSAAVGAMTICCSNDAADGTNTTQFEASIGAFMVWLGLQPAQVQQIANITFAGTWSTNTYNGLAAKYSDTAGSTATATVSGTTIYVGATEFNSLTSSFTVKVDGTTCFTASGVTIANDGYGQLVRCSGLAAGSHTVVVTATTNGNYAVVSWIGGNQGNTGALPLELIGNTLPRTGISSGTIATYNAALATIIGELQTDGLNIIAVNDNPALSTSATPPEYEGTGTHPNALGNLLLTNVFLNAIYASNAVANLNAQYLAAELQAVLNLPATPLSPTPIGSSTSPCNTGYAALDGSSFLDVCVGANVWLSIPLHAFHANPGGYPYVVGAVSCTQANCAASATNLVASAANAQYAIDIAVNCVSSTSTATATITVAYTDPSNTAQTVAPVAAAACTTLGTASLASVNHQVIRAKSGTAITYAATTANTPTYQASVTVAQETSN